MKAQTNIHEAEQYLRDNRQCQLYVRYKGERRRLFITSDSKICMIAKGRRNRGFMFSDWDGVSKIYYPNTDDTNKQRKLVEKYRKEASKASFTNPFIRKCLNADAEKNLYENGITTGNAIDGQIISLKTIEKYAGKGFY